MTMTYAFNTSLASYLKCSSAGVSRPFYRRCFPIRKKEVQETLMS